MSAKNSSSLHARVTGSGAPVVFVHGAAATANVFASQFQAFRDFRSSYFVDLPGHGKSPRIPEMTLDGYVESLAAFLATLDFSATLVGHSLGGAIVQRLVISHGDLVNGIVLVGTGCRLPPLQMTVDEIVRRSYSADADPEILQRARQEIEKINADAVRADFEACATFDSCAAVSGITMPALIICGSADSMTPPHLSEQLHRSIGQSRLHVIPNGSHMVMFEKPDEFNGLVRLFLRENRTI